MVYSSSNELGVPINPMRRRRHVSLGKKGLSRAREGGELLGRSGHCRKISGDNKAKCSIRENHVSRFAWQIKEALGLEIGTTFT